MMEQLDAARDDLLDEEDHVVGRVKDVKAVEKRLRHRLLPRNAWRLVPSLTCSCLAARTSCTNGMYLVWISMY